MSLRDIVSNADLSLYPQVALCLFLAAFVAVALRVVLRGSAAEWERAAALPLEAGAPVEAEEVARD